MKEVIISAGEKLGIYTMSAATHLLCISPDTLAGCRVLLRFIFLLLPRSAALHAAAPRWSE
jgi:hypothetical protein